MHAPVAPAHMHADARAFHAFDNLVVMCQPHHTVIDADEVAYTVERLQDLKQQHEAGQHGQA